MNNTTLSSTHENVLTQLSKLGKYGPFPGINLEIFINKIMNSSMEPNKKIELLALTEQKIKYILKHYELLQIFMTEKMEANNIDPTLVTVGNLFPDILPREPVQFSSLSNAQQSNEYFNKVDFDKISPNELVALTREDEYVNVFSRLKKLFSEYTNNISEIDNKREHLINLMKAVHYKWKNNSSNVPSTKKDNWLSEIDLNNISPNLLVHVIENVEEYNLVFASLNELFLEYKCKLETLDVKRQHIINLMRALYSKHKSESSTRFSFDSSNTQPFTGFSFSGSSSECPSTGFSFGDSSNVRPSTGFSFGDLSNVRHSTGFSFSRSLDERPSTGFGFGGSSSERPSTGFSFGGLSSERPSAGFGGSFSERPSTGFSFGGSFSERPSTGFSFGGSSSERPSTGFGFGSSNSQPSAGFSCGSSNSQPSTGFSFGPSNSRPFTGFSFGSSNAQPSTGFSFGSSNINERRFY